jgi:hypothetical protein
MTFHNLIVIRKLADFRKCKNRELRRAAIVEFFDGLWKFFCHIWRHR